MNTMLDYVLSDDLTEEEIDSFVNEMIDTAKANELDKKIVYQFNKEAPEGLRSKTLGVAYKFNKDPEYGKYTIYLLYDYVKDKFIIYREGFNVSDRNSIKYLYYWVNDDRNNKE